MKRNYVFYFLLLCLIPFHVHAYELDCDKGPLKFNSTFYCSVLGDENLNYESISGTMKENEYASCVVSYHGNGLTNELNAVAGKSFSYKGRALSEIITQYKCQVIKKPASDMQIQLQIDDFKYKLDGEAAFKEEVLRSDSIELSQYIEPTTTTTTKPRDTSNSNARLKSITDPSFAFNFSGFKTEYDVQVPYETERLNLKIEPFNKDASIRTVGNMNLTVGKNTIDIYVTSPDGAARTCYTLNITRLEEGKNIYNTDGDSTLSNLTIIGHSIPFKKETLEYSIHLDQNTSSLKIEPTTSFEGATYSINKTENIQNGDRILITVTSKDKSSTTVYQIKVTKDVPKKMNMKYFILGGLGGAILIIIGLIVYTSKKNKNDPVLRLKKEKKRKNKGQKFNATVVPEAESQVNVVSSTENTQMIQNNGVSVNQGTTLPTEEITNIPIQSIPNGGENIQPTTQVTVENGQIPIQQMNQTSINVVPPQNINLNVGEVPVPSQNIETQVPQMMQEQGQQVVQPLNTPTQTNEQTEQMK